MSDATAQMAEGLTQMLEVFAPMREAALGYRQHLIDSGVGPEAADSMAADWHRSTMQVMTQQLLKGST